MESRIDLQQNAEHKLEQSIAKELSVDSDVSALYQELKAVEFLRITPPQEEAPTMQYITMDSLKHFKQGSSIKAGNIRLNFKKLFCALPVAVPAAVNLTGDNPILRVCAALTLWKALREVLTVQITKEQAFVIAALWKECDPKHQITPAHGLDAVHRLLASYGEADMTEIKYHAVLDELVQLGCVEIKGDVLWLREWISRSYVDAL